MNWNVTGGRGDMGPLGGRLTGGRLLIGTGPLSWMSSMAMALLWLGVVVPSGCNHLAGVVFPAAGAAGRVLWVGRTC